MMNAFTVDVEDYFHVSAFADRIRVDSWGDFECRVEMNTRRLLDLLARFQVRGTFFVLGWVAERYPELIREIHRAGHEIGCHSYHHQLIYNLTPQAFREDLCRSRDILQELTGSAVRSYRAPSFSIVKKSWWALEILVEEGFDTDSSVYPIHHDRYGVPDASLTPFKIQTQSGVIWEFPATVSRLAGCNIPVGGGGYFRLFPWGATRRLLNRVNDVENRPFMVYIHPWEIDPDQPRLSGKWLSRFRHTVNLSKTMRRLELLLGKFQFGTMTETLASAGYRPTAEALPFRTPEVLPAS